MNDKAQYQQGSRERMRWVAAIMYWALMCLSFFALLMVSALGLGDPILGAAVLGSLGLHLLAASIPILVWRKSLPWMMASLLAGLVGTSAISFLGLWGLATALSDSL